MFGRGLGRGSLRVVEEGFKEVCIYANLSYMEWITCKYGFHEWSHKMKISKNILLEDTSNKHSPATYLILDALWRCSLLLPNP